MKTPTLVLAVILAMAVVGDSVNMEKILRQLQLLAGEEASDEATTKNEGESLDLKGTKLLDVVQKLTLASSTAYPEDVGGEIQNDVAEIGDQDPSLEVSTTKNGEDDADIEGNNDVAEIEDQDTTPKGNDNHFS
ncbi:uncharacterized protein [Branchiostoma lanceolatum]|uniref:uncharacterized protein n=1 Tax=Branchiostoma lanceolatum TaxID=7740 RepID=UPI003453E9F3